MKIYNYTYTHTHTHIYIYTSIEHFKLQSGFLIFIHLYTYLWSCFFINRQNLWMYYIHGKMRQEKPVYWHLLPSGDFWICVTPHSFYHACTDRSSDENQSIYANTLFLYILTSSPSTLFVVLRNSCPHNIFWICRWHST